MPIYEYRCGDCDQHVELLVRASGVTPLCPTCGSPLTNKLFSVPNILSGRTRPPAGHACCGQEEDCDEALCQCGEGCRHA